MHTNIDNMETATTKGIEDRFTAAVNVIRGLPKNGSYQPSNEMMLRFYSYFKQATLGPCNHKKPPFWDVVGRAKFDSYKALGKMSKEQAMELYVEELKKIIETMSYTDNVAEFMGSISELDGIDVSDLEAVAPDAIKKVKSQPNSPFASRECSPIRVTQKSIPYRNGTAAIENGYANTNGHYVENGNGVHLQNGHSHNAEHSDDEYIDTVEDDTHLIEEPTVRFSRTWSRRSRPQLMAATTASTNDIAATSTANIPSDGTNNHSVVGPSSSSSTSASHSTELLPAIHQLIHNVEHMRCDVQQINARLNQLERSLTEVKNHQLRKKIMELRYPKWWPFTEISPTWFVFMLVSPFLAQRLMNRIQQKK